MRPTLATIQISGGKCSDDIYPCQKSITRRGAEQDQQHRLRKFSLVTFSISLHQERVPRRQSFMNVQEVVGDCSLYLQFWYRVPEKRTFHLQVLPPGETGRNCPQHYDRVLDSGKEFSLPSPPRPRFGVRPVSTTHWNHWRQRVPGELRRRYHKGRGIFSNLEDDRLCSEDTPQPTHGMVVNTFQGASILARITLTAANSSSTKTSLKGNAWVTWINDE